MACDRNCGFGHNHHRDFFAERKRHFHNIPIKKSLQSLTMELTTEQLIKITIGVFVIAVVVGGLYFFGSTVIDFFKNIPTGK